MFKYFLTALHDPIIPTITPITNNNNDIVYTNGTGGINLINGENNCPPKFS